MLTSSEKAELRRCASDFIYFLVHYIWIESKEHKRVRFILNRPQRKALRVFLKEKWILILKARQHGISTLIAAWFLWQAMFWCKRALIMSETVPAARDLFKKYRNMYNDLPDWMRRLKAFKARVENVNELEFGNRGIIKVVGPDYRGSTFQLIHASEAAFYANFTDTAAAIFQMASAEAQVILETTANGPNEFYYLWNGHAQEGMPPLTFFKLFLPWTYNDDYVDKPIKGEPTDWEREYQAAWGLSPERMGWVRKTLTTKCVGNPTLFNQEYPLSAELAFILSGSKYFSVTYPNDPKTSDVDGKVVGVDARGLVIYEKPAPYHTYLMGVDTCSGALDPKLDQHAVVIMDATQLRVGVNNKIKVVATLAYQDELRSYAVKVHELAQMYTAFVTVEANSYGATIIEYLISVAYPWLYRRKRLDGFTNQWMDQIGFTTTRQTRPELLSKMQELLSKGQLDVKCPRLMQQINTFVHGPKHPEAAAGGKDDLVFGCGLGLRGLEQAPLLLEENTMGKRPSGIQEILDWERTTRRIYDPREFFGDDGQFAEPGNAVILH